MSIEVDPRDLERVAAKLRKAADAIERAVPGLVTDAVREVHDAMASSWPSPIGVATHQRGKNTTAGVLDFRERNRSELMAEAVAHAKVHHAHTHAVGRGGSHKHRGRSRSRGIPASSPRLALRSRRSRGGGGDQLVTILTRGDENVCPICTDLEGITYTIEEANEILPVHPNCRCVWVPARDLRFNPVIPEDPGEALVKALMRRVPDLTRRLRTG